MGQIAILIDPEKPSVSLTERMNKLHSLGFYPNLVLLGGSTGTLDSESVFDEADHWGLPVWLFPGNENQLTARAKGLFLPVLISGRNAEMLIGKHVAAARRIQSLSIPVRPMSYILIDGGKTTSVQRISKTQPLDPKDVETIVSTALAGEQLGHVVTYLEAGSGALHHVPLSVIAAVREAVQTTLIVGGGLRSKEAIEAVLAAGADIVVIGNALE